MEPLGVLLYGYDSTMAEKIKKMFMEILKDNVILISGSSKEDMKVMDILEKGPTEDFEESEHKILVFLGFDDQQVSSVLNSFPKDGEIKRPIFCGLTEQNINWPLKDLIEHLVEEDKYWAKKRSG